MEDEVVRIKQNLKATQVRQKIYANKSMTTREFKVGEHVLLKVKPKKISLKLSSWTNPTTIFYGPFEILERIGLLAYMLVLLTSMNVHNVFHVSLLRKYVPDSNHIIERQRENFRSIQCEYWIEKSKCFRIEL
jgi:hypothetical protein